MDNTKFLNLLEPSIVTIPAHLNLLPAHPNCGIRSKNIKTNQKNILCSNCYHYIHKKCSKIKNNDHKHIDWKHWECLTCLHTKFPFTYIKLDELTWMSYNFNLPCLCPQKHSSPTNLNNLLKSLSNKDSPFYENDPCEYINIQPNFKFYDIHDLHKLDTFKDKTINNNFSIFHTNICSLQSNFDNRENLLNDLNHGFDVISLTETWNPENKNHLFSADKLDKYHPFKGTT